jgi:hypothetical protein
MHIIYLASKLHIQLQIKFEKREKGEKEWKNSH